MHAYCGEHKQLVKQFSPVFLMIQDNPAVLKTSLKAPDDPVRFLTVAVRKVDDVGIYIILTH